MMNKSSLHLSDVQLQAILFDDESPSVNSATSQHVESCEACRDRLELMSGSDAFDEETREMLVGFTEPSSCFSLVSQDSLGHELDKPTSGLGPLSAPSHPELLGRLGRYDVEGVVGVGGMSVVYKGFDVELNRPVALKVLAQHLSNSGAARQRFSREAKAVAGVVHENVIAIHNVETVGQTSFLVMPYIAGESLQDRVEREGALDPVVLLRIAIQTAAGLQAAHQQGVVHRDVKPGNILLEGEIERVLVTDFGLAQTVDDASLTRTGVVSGTPNYMSPEQAMGHPTDPRSDLFSLGCVLYFMATGHPPFRADKAMGVLNRVCHDSHTPVWRRQPEIPDELSDAIDRLLEKKPSHRFASAKQLHRVLLNILQRLQDPSQRRRRVFNRAVRVGRKMAGAVLEVKGLAAMTLLGLVAAGLLGAMVAGYFQNSTVPSQVVSSFDHNGQQLADEVTSQENHFSVDVWQQASTDELQRWNNSVAEIHAMLNNCDSSNISARHVTGHWRQSIESIQNEVDLLEGKISAP